MITTTEETNKTAWLGEFPPHWQVLRIKNLFREIDNRSESGAEELLSVSHYTGVTLKRESLENEDDHLTNAESLEGYKLVEPGDLVVNIMLAWNGSMGISPYKGITSPAYSVYRIKERNNPEYFGYLFTTALFKAEFRRNSTGIIDSRLRLYSDKFFSIFTVVPPKEEQDTIVEFIKAKEEKINLFIEKKRRLIELLKEQRQSVIDEVITRGNNTKAKLKSSEIEWLDKVPEHWKTFRLRFLCNITTGGKNTEDRNDDGEYPFYVRSQTVEKINSYSFDGVGILTAGDGVGVGRVFHLAEGKYDFHQRVYLFYEISEQILPEFLFSYLQNNLIKELMRYNAKSTVDSVRLPVLKDFQVLVPPIEEQIQIVEHIKKETITIDAAIAKAEKEIELVREFKEAMIAEVVMGKELKE